MKTKEFIRRVEELGLRVEEDWGIIIIYNSDGIRYLATVNKLDEYQFNTLFEKMGIMCMPSKIKLFELLVEYAKTPIEER